VKSDALLITEALEGRESSFSLLVTKYWKRVFYVVRRRVEDNALAEEITQEAFISAYKYLHTFKGDSSLYTWLCTIAINKSRVRPSRGLQMDVEIAITCTPETLLETKQEIVGIMEMLPKKQQQALYLKECQGLCYADVGLDLGCTAGYAKKLVYKAKQTIRSSYDK
jgi:RNA polymerase sigma-70 factor (ECF subfamily)